MPFTTQWKSKKTFVVWKGYGDDQSRKWRHEADHIIVWRLISWNKKTYRANQIGKKWYFTLNAIDQFIIARKNW